MHTGGEPECECKGNAQCGKVYIGGAVFSILSLT